MNRPTIVVFDLGGVLVDWNPRYMYRRLINDEAEMEFFLTEVCSPAWNEAQDGGRTIAEAVAEATARHPDKSELINAFYERFDEMMAGSIDGTVKILDTLRRQQVPCYALTNWSAETFPLALKRFDFLSWFDGILVSGREGLKKPDPAIFELLFKRFDIDAKSAVFIDDSPRNIAAATDLGLRSIHFTSAEGLQTELRALHFDV